MCVVVEAVANLPRCHMPAVCLYPWVCLGVQEVMVAGGMESMSNAPFYLSRSGPSYGGARLMVGTELCQVARSCIIIISFDSYRKMYCVKLMSACPSGIMVNIKIHTT